MATVGTFIHHHMLLLWMFRWFMLLSVFGMLFWPCCLTAVCPPADLIQPCVCADYFNMIECSNITSNQHLKRIFADLKKELDRTGARPIYDQLKITQTDLVDIGGPDSVGHGDNNEDLFSGISFRRIALFRNRNLRRIDPMVFQGSFNICTEMNIENNQLLASEPEPTVALFRALNQFTQLNTLFLTENGVRFIPEKAFAKEQSRLRELFMTENHIERIEDNAFIGLHSLELINLDGNQIRHLSKQSFNIGPWPKNTNQDAFLRIFLSSNHLQTESFPGPIFAWLRRKTYLNLNMNNLTKLPQEVFQPFFKRGSVLSLAKNGHLLCDCDFHWLFRQGLLYQTANAKKKDYQLREYSCMTDGSMFTTEVEPNDFEHCPEEIINNDQEMKHCFDQASNLQQEIECINSNDNSFNGDSGFTLSKQYYSLLLLSCLMSYLFLV